MEFTTDWQKDAERRDLTINSMFLGKTWRENEVLSWPKRLLFRRNSKRATKCPRGFLLRDRAALELGARVQVGARHSPAMP